MSELRDPAPGAAAAAAPYDALLLVSFGGPEGPDDVVPFLENVTRGRGIPPERLKEVGAHYFQFGGVSPINEQCRDLIAALREDFAEHGLNLPVYWGNRNWAPYLADTLREMGPTAGAASRCSPPARTPPTPAAGSTARTWRRRWRRFGTRASSAQGRQAPALLQPPRLRRADDRRRPGVARRAARDVRAGAHLVFTTHSIPTAARRHLRPVAEHGDGGAYVRAAPGRGAADRRARSPPRPASSGPGELVYQLPLRRRRTSPGSNPTSATTCATSTAQGATGRRHGPRSASSPTTWRSCTTSTRRPPPRPPELGLPVARAATVGDRSAVRRRRARARAWSAPRPSAATPRPSAAASSARSAPRTTSVPCRLLPGRPRRAEPAVAAGADSPYSEGQRPMSDNRCIRRTAGARPATAARQAGRLLRRRAPAPTSPSPPPSPARPTW